MENVAVSPEQMNEIQKAKIAELGRKRVPRFRVGELIPFKGVWFTVKEVQETGLVLEAKAYTAKGEPR